MVITEHSRVEWQEVGELDETDRGSGGFGHTGKN
jgi:dUTP pyrophosphatase